MPKLSRLVRFALLGTLSSIACLYYLVDTYQNVSNRTQFACTAVSRTNATSSVRIAKAANLDPGSAPSGCVLTNWNGPNFQMCLHPSPDLISDRIRENGMWEKAWLSRFRSDIANLGPDGLVIDIGANLGEYGLLAGQMGRHAILIEPMNTNAERVEASISANDWDRDSKRMDRIHVIHAGVSCSPFLSATIQTLNKGGSWTGKVSDSVKLAEIGAYLKTATTRSDHSYVHGITLDSLEERKLIPDTAAKDGILMKIDVEGAECEAIMSGVKFLRKYARSLRAIYMEWSGYGKGELPDGCDVAAMVDFLYELGFRPYLDINLSPGGPLAPVVNTGIVPVFLQEGAFLPWMRLYRKNWRTWPYEVVFFR